MSNYIIDPAVIYWLNVLGRLHDVTKILMIMSIICCGVTGLFIVMMHASDENVPKVTYKALAVFMVLAVVSTLLNVFAPTQETCIQMLVARVATVENVDWTVAQVKEIIDYIVTALKGVT